MKAIVYEGFQHFVPTGEGWAKGLEDLGFTVYRLPNHSYGLDEVDEEVDLVIVHDVNERVANGIHSYKSTFPLSKIAVLTSTYENCYNNLQKDVDLWFNLSIRNTYLSKVFGDKGMKFVPISLASHKDYSFPMNLKRTFDVSFIGQIGSQGHGYRNEDQYLFPVIEKGYNGIYGGFKGFAPIHHSKLNEVYNKTKVNLNFHYSNQKVESETDPMSRIEFNGRVFEIAMSGNFQISDHPFISEIFEDSIPYVTPEKWIDTIDYYLENELERNKLARDAYYIAMNKHTYACRATQILKESGVW